MLFKVIALVVIWLLSISMTGRFIGHIITLLAVYILIGEEVGLRKKKETKTEQEVAEIETTTTRK